MADPGNPSEFSPAELDRLEDALEQWTGEQWAGDDFDAVPEDSSLPAPLRARLADYREVLTLSREALALEDVPEGLLASVLAEAHASAASAPLPAQRAPAGPSLWERLRRSLLLPGVALAGSTALLLWLVQPGEQEQDMLANLSAERSPATDIPALTPLPPAPARLTPGDGPAPAGPELAEPAAAAPSAAAEGSKANEEMALGATAPSDAAADHKELDGLKSDAKGASKSSRRKDADVTQELEVLPGLGDAPTQDADKEALRDTLEQADTQRRAGRCEAAMALYEQAFVMSGPVDEEARARAGYGLCLASRGEDGKAEKYFEYATKHSPGVASWIARERGDGASSKKRAKPSPAKAKMPPFEPLKGE